MIYNIFNNYYWWNGILFIIFVTDYLLLEKEIIFILIEKDIIYKYIYI